MIRLAVFDQINRKTYQILKTRKRSQSGIFGGCSKSLCLLSVYCIESNEEKKVGLWQNIRTEQTAQLIGKSTDCLLLAMAFSVDLITVVLSLQQPISSSG